MPKKTKFRKSLIIQNCFSLKEIDIEIIRIIVEFGPLNKSQIDKHSTYTKRQIEYRFETFLLPNSFIRILTERPYRNIKKAFGDKKITEKIYSLDNKGFCASLPLLNVRDNFFLKYYVEQHPEEIRDVFYDYIEKRCALLYDYFFMIGLQLDKLKDIDGFMHEYNFHSNLSLRTKKDDLDRMVEIDILADKIAEYANHDYSNENTKFWLREHWYDIGSKYPKTLKQIINVLKREEKRSTKETEKLLKEIERDFLADKS